MSSAAATFPGVSAYQRRHTAPRNQRRTRRRGLVLAFTAVATVAVMGSAATAVAALMVGEALESTPGLATRAPRTLRSAAIDPYARFAEAGALASPLRVASAAATVPVSVRAAPSAAAIPSSPQAAAEPTAPSLDDQEIFTASLTPSSSPPRTFEPAARLVPEREAALPPVPRRLPVHVPLLQPPRHDIAGRVSGPPLTHVALAAPPSSADLPQKHLTPEQQTVPPLLAGVDAHTAIYDIVAHTVYLPNGQRLEAHSGLGSRLDDPRFIRDKGRGPTPPNVYDLALRGERFHGVQAIRLKPVDDGKMYGRDGILAHTYMLGPSGQSFGCVSFKNYPQFLDAFLRGEINRLVVVPHLDSRALEAHARRADAGGPIVR